MSAPNKVRNLTYQYIKWLKVIRSTVSTTQLSAPHSKQTYPKIEAYKGNEGHKLLQKCSVHLGCA